MRLQAIATYFKCLLFNQKRLISFLPLSFPCCNFFLCTLSCTLLCWMVLPKYMKQISKYISPPNFTLFFFLPQFCSRHPRGAKRKWSGLKFQRRSNAPLHLFSLSLLYSSTKSLFLVTALPLHPHHSPLVTLFSAESRQAFGRRKSLAAGEEPAKMLLR